MFGRLRSVLGGGVQPAEEVVPVGGSAEGSAPPTEADEESDPPDPPPEVGAQGELEGASPQTMAAEVASSGSLEVSESPDEAALGSDADAEATSTEERRARPRLADLPHCIRVRSKHLPLFQGLTHEISEGGLRLVVEGEVPEGRVLEMEIQLDHFRLPDVRARGTVVWCEPRDDRSWWVGVQLDEVEGEGWAQYVAEVAEATKDGLTRHNFLDS